MYKHLFKNYIYPIAVFSGGMIGVGFLSLPYIALKAGIWITLLYLFLLTALTIKINSIFCRISLKTPDFKRFPGFVGYYLGKKWEIFAMVLTIIATFGVMLVYLIIGGQFLSSAFNHVFSGNALICVLIYFLIASIIIYFDIEAVSKAEFWIITMLFLALLFIFIEGFSQIKISNIFIIDWKTNIPNFFLPYGPLLFALWGVTLIPEVEEMIAGNKKRLNSIVAISTGIISFFYLLFVLLILGIAGKQTSPSAIIGLEKFLPSALVSISLLLGVLATFTAFITQGIILKKTFMFDLKIKHWQAFIMTCFPPLILFLLGLKSFIFLISLTGGLLLGIDGILILFMYKKIGGKNAIIYPLSLIFLVGIIYEIVYLFK